MTISRVNTSGWLFEDELSRASLNDMDGYSTFLVDKRKNYPSVIGSNISLDSGSSLTVEQGSRFQVQSAENIRISSGSLAIGCELAGQSHLSTASHPIPATAANVLKFGRNSITLDATPYTLNTSQYNKFVITLSSSLVGDTAVIFPAVSGYSKLVDNQTGFIVALSCSGGTNVVYVQNNEQVSIYCDGTDVYAASDARRNTIISKQFLTPLGTPPSIPGVSAHSESTLYQQVSNALLFRDVKVGDRFEISFQATVIGLGTTEVPGSLYASGLVSVIPGLSNPITDLPETEVFNPSVDFLASHPTRGSCKTVFTAYAADIHTFYISFKSPTSPDNNASISNATLIVTQYR